MKILFILHLPPPVHGAAIIGENIKISTKINNLFHTKYLNLSTSKKINEIGKSPFIKFFRYLKILFSTVQLLLTFRPDIVYITLSSSGIGFLKDSIIALIAKMFRVKIVYHFHNKGIVKYQNRVFYNLIYKLILKNSKVILLSKLLYSDVEKYVKLKDVFYCPNGIKDLNEENYVRKSNSTIKLLFFSNIIKSKGIIDLVEACEILLKKRINFICNIVGNEGDLTEKELNSIIISKNLKNHMFYLGKKYDKSKIEIFNESDIFIHPTHNDCFPLVLLEAMQFNLAIISTNEGAISEIINNNICGLLIPKKNVILLAENIEKLISQTELRNKLGNNARIKFLENYSLEKFEDNFMRIMYEIYEN